MFSNLVRDLSSHQFSWITIMLYGVCWFVYWPRAERSPVMILLFEYHVSDEERLSVVDCV